MKRLLFLPFITTFITLALTASCDTDSEREKAAIEVCNSFSSSYFTWHFPEAMDYADEDGQQWLRFMASNVHKADLDLIASTKEAPAFEIDNVEVRNDSAFITLNLSNVILMDTIGKSAHFHDSAQRLVILRLTEKQWKVNKISIVPCQNN